jgi:hypothetical protein
MEYARLDLLQRALRHGARYAGYVLLVAVTWQLARLLVLPNSKSRRKRLGESSRQQQDAREETELFED